MSYLSIFRLKLSKNYWGVSNHQSRNCKNAMFLPKQKKLHLGTKCFVVCFWENIWKFAKFRAKQKDFKFGSKIGLFGYFKLEFEKTIVVFDASTLDFVKMQSSAQNKKCSSLRSKSLYLGFDCILKNYCHIWNQHSRIC